jgi:hypothetical protein
VVHIHWNVEAPAALESTTASRRDFHSSTGAGVVAEQIPTTKSVALRRQAAWVVVEQEVLQTTVLVHPESPALAEAAAAWIQRRQTTNPAARVLW